MNHFINTYNLIYKLNRPFHATWLTVPSVIAGGLEAHRGIELFPFFYSRFLRGLLRTSVILLMIILISTAM